MLFGLIAAAALATTPPADTRRGGTPVPDHELATMRGGLMLPNGLDIAIGIDIQTRVDGVLALHTIFSSEAPTSGVRVYTDGVTSPSQAPGTVTVATGAQDWPTVTVPRSPTGTTVSTGAPPDAGSINIVSGPTASWLDAAGQNMVPVTSNGPAVGTDAGAIRLTSDDRGTQVALVTPTLEVRHLVGQATGVVVSNTANDTAIDTVSTINVNLTGVPANLLGGVLMVNRIAAEAAGRR